MEKKKVCSKCQEEKSLNEFGNLKKGKDGKMPMCKVCNRTRGKKYHNTKKGLDLTAGVFKVSGNSTPVQLRYVKKGNKLNFGNLFQNNNVNEDFVMVLHVWDNDQDGNKVLVESKHLFVRKDKWNDQLSFTEVDKLEKDLQKVSDENWSEFCKNYKDRFENEKKRKLHLRFKKHYGDSKQVQVGLSFNELEDLTEEFSL